MGSTGFPRAEATTRSLSRCRSYVRPIRPAPRSPITPVERLVLARLEGESAMDLEMLLGLVSRDVYLEALRRGAWLADVGLMGWHYWERQVIEELEAASGILWQLEAAEGEHCGVPS